MKLPALLSLSAVAFVALFAAFLFSTRHHAGRSPLLDAATWQQMAEPGELSRPHAFLENNCAACHTPVAGVEARNCIVCHADNDSLLQREPTAFHANIGECAACHREHEGRVQSATQMDHAALAHIGCKMLERSSSPAHIDMAAIKRWLDESSASARPASHRAAEEALLNCAACHQTKDKHRGFFGANCADCHATSQWTIAAFGHPSAASQSCAQCHQAPPSHYMMHFQMVSVTVAKQEHANVTQCFLCHQTTAWNDIKGVGYYKHH